VAVFADLEGVGGINLLLDHSDYSAGRTSDAAGVIGYDIASAMRRHLPLVRKSALGLTTCN
jgi:hypothetical protein